jgi:hypothetical protein
MAVPTAATSASNSTGFQKKLFGLLMVDVAKACNGFFYVTESCHDFGCGTTRFSFQFTVKFVRATCWK